MDERTRCLVRLSAGLTGEEEGLRAAMDEAAATAPVEAEEVLLQSYLFLGIPVALNAFGLWRRRTGHGPPPRRGRGERGAEGDVAEEGVTDGSGPPAGDAWLERGEAVCRAVYGQQYEALREVMAGIHPELDRWAIAEGYGKVLGREALDLRTRELCVAAVLAGTSASRQLHAHLRGCLNVGATVEDVDETLEAIRDLLPPGRAEEADRIWRRVRSRWTERMGG